MPIISLFASPAFFSDLPHPASDSNNTTASAIKSLFFHITLFPQYLSLFVWHIYPHYVVDTDGILISIDLRSQPICEACSDEGRDMTPVHPARISFVGNIYEVR